MPATGTNTPETNPKSKMVGVTGTLRRSVTETGMMTVTDTEMTATRSTVGNSSVTETEIMNILKVRKCTIGTADGGRKAQRAGGGKGEAVQMRAGMNPTRFCTDKTAVRKRGPKKCTV